LRNIRTPRPTLALYAIQHHTLLVMTISCKCLGCGLGVWLGLRLGLSEKGGFTVALSLCGRFSESGLREIPQGGVTPQLSLACTRYSFTPKLSCTSRSSLYCPLHLHCSHSCSTIARLMRDIRPPSDPPCVCHTAYTNTIGQENIVQMLRLRSVRLAPSAPRP